MSLLSIANSYIQTANPNISATWKTSTGYTTDAAGKRTPTYSTATVSVNAQAVTGEALKHVDGLNIQGVMRSLYVYGNAQGVVRTDVKGGDVFEFAQIPGAAAQAWKVASVVETWPEWSHVVVVLQ